MNLLFEYLSRLFAQWKFWIVIAPWDIGVRIRLGKNAISLSPGFHFRIPFIDDITLINTRQRVTSTPCVTLEGSIRGYSIVKSASIGFRIVDPIKAMLRYSGMEYTIVCLTQAEITAKTDEKEAEKKLKMILGEHGVEVDFIRYIENVQVKTFRLLNENWRPTTNNEPTSLSNGIQITPRF